MTVHVIHTTPSRYNVPKGTKLTADVSTWHVDGRTIDSHTDGTVFRMAFPCNNSRSNFAFGMAGPTDLHNWAKHDGSPNQLVQRAHAWLIPMATVIQAAHYGNLGRPARTVELADGDLLVDVEANLCLKVVAPTGPQAAFKEPALVVLHCPKARMDRSAHVAAVNAARAADSRYGRDSEAYLSQ
jgi:hypothetical protein